MGTASIGKAISAATLHRRLHMNGLYALVPRVCVPLSVQSRGAQLKWCREHGNWTVSDWGNVMFTDESRFTLEPDDKRIRIWWKQETRNQPQNITEHHAFRGGSIMVWAGISLGYRTDLHIFKKGSMTAVRYRDEVLEPVVKLYATTVGPTFVLKDARPKELTSAKTTWRVKGLRVWWGQNIHPTLIPLKIFRMFSAVLYLHVSHLQSLFLSWKLLYKKNGDCLMLWWLTT
ncbi:transposable element Tcb1 transposase [Trichonephila clavipes]|nr:transposable element Tcb1 transposase [Trichonephila clavipes]